MGEFDELESLAEMFRPDLGTDRKLSPKGRAACRAGALKVIERAQTNQKSAIARLANSARTRRQRKSAPITLAPIRGGAS